MKHLQIHIFFFNPIDSLTSNYLLLSVPWTFPESKKYNILAIVLQFKDHWRKQRGWRKKFPSQIIHPYTRKLINLGHRGKANLPNYWANFQSRVLLVTRVTLGRENKYDEIKKEYARKLGITRENNEKVLQFATISLCF